MNEIINNSDRGDKEFVVIRDQSVSVQTIQAIFSEITGKSEALTERFDIAYRITKDDIEAIYHKIEQTSEQYNVKGKSVVFSLSYYNNTKEELNSIDRFVFQCRASSSQIEAVSIKFSFLIMLPQVDKVQTYTISLLLLSGIALRRKFEEEDGASLPFFMSRNTKATSKIEFVDYSVARSFQAVIRE